MIEDLKPNRQTAIILHKLRKGGRLPDNDVLSNLLGYVKPITVQQWFSGRARPDLAQCRKIAEIARVHPLTLLPCWLSDADPRGGWEYDAIVGQIVAHHRETIEAVRVTLTDDDVPDDLAP